jgi:predicted nucleic acid-binding protein
MKLYLDSMIWVYFLERHPVFGKPAHDFVFRMRDSNHELHSSNLVLAEVLVIPKRNADVFTAAQYRRLFRPPGVTIIQLTTDAAERFADIRASARVKPADALHLALAASVGTDYFVTTDTRLHSLSIPDIGKICPPEVVPAG